MDRIRQHCSKDICFYQLAKTFNPLRKNTLDIKKKLKSCHFGGDFVSETSSIKKFTIYSTAWKNGSICIVALITNKYK
jgi:hypothetical protein